ncbi:hypothetical protein RB195_000310 [Necator americanus]|uniref:Uncharacterized protein n=1 Tax=Necator americanus TaxID=51031 RepID=A0ABR1D910_NECAM
MIGGEKSWMVSFPSYRILPEEKNIGYGLSTQGSSAQDRDGTNPNFTKHIVESKRHEARCIDIRARNGTVEAAVGIEVGPSQTAAMGDARNDSSTLLTATLHRTASREAA